MAVQHQRDLQIAAEPPIRSRQKQPPSHDDAPAAKRLKTEDGAISSTGSVKRTLSAVANAESDRRKVGRRIGSRGYVDWYDAAIKELTGHHISRSGIAKMEAQLVHVGVILAPA